MGASDEVHEATELTPSDECLPEVLDLENGGNSGGGDEGEIMGRFCIRRVISVLEKCSQNADVDIKYYLDAHKELIKFIKSMGYAFGFAASDVHKKVSLLESLRAGENGHHYSTVAGMIEHESGGESARADMTGCLTLLILHRALAFVMGLLRVIGSVQPVSQDSSADVSCSDTAQESCGLDESMCRVSKQIYANTMGQYHNWVVRKAASLAILTLGTRRQMFKQVVEDVEEELGYRLISDCVHRLNTVHHHIDKLYENPKLDTLK